MYERERINKAINYVEARFIYGMRTLDAIESASFVYRLNYLEYAVAAVICIWKFGI